MKIKVKKLTIDLLVNKFSLKVLVGENQLLRKITQARFHCPGLEFVGHFDFFPTERVQILGIKEVTYLHKLSHEERKARIGNIVQYHPPCFIVTAGEEGLTYLTQHCREHNIPLLLTNKPTNTTDFMAKLDAFMIKELAPQIAVHGVCVNVYGIGILIRGDSGVGKSETAHTLIGRGHRLVADDIVVLKKLSTQTLLGTHDEKTKEFLALRSIGLLNVVRSYGQKAFQNETRIALEILLTKWEKNALYNDLRTRAEIHRLSRSQNSINGNSTSTWTRCSRTHRGSCEQLVFKTTGIQCSRRLLVDWKLNLRKFKTMNLQESEGIRRPNYQIVDAHIDLDQYKNREIERMVKATDEIDGLLTVSTNLQSCKRNLHLSKTYEKVKPAFGYHPEQNLPTDDEMNSLTEWMFKHREDMIAIGEVGLPYYLRQSGEISQYQYSHYIELLEVFIQLAKRWQKPIILHAVYDDASLVCDLLEKYSVSNAHFHWFKGDDLTIARMVENGYFISVTPEIVYKEKIQKLVNSYLSSK